MVTASALLAKLPPYRDQWVTIKENHRVGDIIKQIISAHKKYASYYNKIALYFDADTIEKTCNNLYSFCKREIAYKEESEDNQTTALPVGILYRGEGDCKHYASFCGGVLDAIGRLTGKQINWCYRFASYNLFSQSPHHVFVVVKDRAGEIWIDPVPGANELEPYWQTDKKINSLSMPLRDNIGSVNGFNSQPGYYPDNYQPSMSNYNVVTGADQMGFIDPVTVISVAKTVTNFIKSFGKDQVPNYPVKSENTLNSLKASIATAVPLPPQSVPDAQRLLGMAQQERTLSVARGNDPATQTAIMLWDEVITSLQNYIASNGGMNTGYKGLPGSTSPLSLTAGSFFSNPIVLVGGAAAIIYFLTRNKRVSGGTDMVPVLLGAGALLILLKKKEKPVVVVDSGEAEFVVPETTAARFQR